MARVTQRDIAEQVGVSREAVAFALSPNPQLSSQLGEETRQRIIETARQMQYVPNHAARRLLQSRSPKQSRRFDQAGFLYIPHGGQLDANMGLVCLSMLEGAEQVVSTHHASITFVRVATIQDWDKVDRMIKSQLVDGWLLYGAVTDEILSHLDDTRTPTVIIGDHRCTHPVHAVNHDYEAVGRLAAEHLAGLGHRRIGYCAGSMRYPYQEMALAGYRRAAKDLKLDDRDGLILIQGCSKYQHFLDWIQDPALQPTALFAPELDWAVERHRLLLNAGISVPEDISLLSCSISRPTNESSLTGIHLPMAKIGRRGADLLLQLAKEDKQPAPIQERIAPSLFPGVSTAHTDRIEPTLR